MSRKTDLEHNIRQSGNLVRDLEETLRLSNNPKEQARCQHRIAEQRGLLQDYLQEYVPLCQGAESSIPEDIVEIAAGAGVSLPSRGPATSPAPVSHGDEQRSPLPATEQRPAEAATDMDTSCEAGVKRLLEQMGKGHPRYSDALTLQARLLHSIDEVRNYGETNDTRAEWARVMGALNQLALETVGKDFNQLCGMTTPRRPDTSRLLIGFGVSFFLTIGPILLALGLSRCLIAYRLPAALITILIAVASVVLATVLPFFKPRVRAILRMVGGGIALGVAVFVVIHVLMPPVQPLSCEWLFPASGGATPVPTTTIPQTSAAGTPTARPTSPALPATTSSTVPSTAPTATRTRPTSGPTGTPVPVTATPPMVVISVDNAGQLERLDPPLLKTAGYIRRIAFSPDGRLLSSGKASGDVEVWEMAGRRELCSASGHVWSVFGLAFTPDSAVLASGSRDFEVRLWNPSDCLQRGIIKGHEGGVWTVAFSPDGQVLAVGGEDGKVKIWSLLETLESQSTDPLDVFQAHQTAVYSLAYSPDGRWLVTAGRDGILKTWVAQEEHHSQPEAEVTAHSRAIEKIALSSDGLLLASASQDATVMLWEMPWLAERCRILGHGARVNSVSFAPGGALLASASEDGTIRLWDTQSCTECAVLTPGRKGVIWDVAFSPDGTLLAAGGEDGAIWLWGVSP